MRKIILASNSKRRHELAKTMGLDFEIIPSDYDEDMTLNMKPKDMVKTFAYGKASEVALRYEDAIVIGVDTIVVYKEDKLGKPNSREEAYIMLKKLSGNIHKVYSGIAIIDTRTKKTIMDHEVTRVFFKSLSDQEIKNYVNTGEPLDKAGAYGIQDLSSIFIRKIDGCYFNVMGFPIYNIYKNLEKLGINIFEYNRWQKK